MKGSIRPAPSGVMGLIGTIVPGKGSISDVSCGYCEELLADGILSITGVEPCAEPWVASPVGGGEVGHEICRQDELYPVRVIGSLRSGESLHYSPPDGTLGFGIVQMF